MIETERLLLRNFTLQDAPTVQKLAGAREIAATNTSIPHPYEDGMAEAWISQIRNGFIRGDQVMFAIVLKKTNELIGAIGFVINKEHERAEFGYWIGVPYWGNGYCTEAAKAVIKLAFTDLKLHRVFSILMTHNTASVKVLKKIGMKYEGLFRDYVKKWGKFEDIEQYGMLASDFYALQADNKKRHMMEEM